MNENGERRGKKKKKKNLSECKVEVLISEVEAADIRSCLALFPPESAPKPQKTCMGKCHNANTAIVNLLPHFAHTVIFSFIWMHVDDGLFPMVLIICTQLGIN